MRPYFHLKYLNTGANNFYKELNNLDFVTTMYRLIVEGYLKQSSFNERFSHIRGCEVLKQPFISFRLSSFSINPFFFMK